MISTRRDSLKKEPSDKEIDNTTVSDKKRNSTGSTSTANNSTSKMSSIYYNKASNNIRSGSVGDVKTTFVVI